MMCFGEKLVFPSNAEMCLFETISTPVVSFAEERDGTRRVVENKRVAIEKIPRNLERPFFDVSLENVMKSPFLLQKVFDGCFFGQFTEVQSIMNFWPVCNAETI